MPNADEQTQTDRPEPRSPRQVFETLIGLDTAERDAALRRLAIDDPKMEARVRALLVADQVEGDPTLNDLPPLPPVFLQPGDRFQDYTILEHLGEGGFGSVYKAEQRHPIRRTVALKVVKPGVDTREVLARFSSERQALARMEHPHIAKVIHAGSTDSGRPYFVMEYVPGIPITRFADDNKLTITQRLDLFKQVCDAINHAHIKQIVHRDIKAANVLAYRDQGTADGKPTVKVIDFGIAKALTSDRLTDLTFNTARGSVIGTYSTMSPEQAAGSPDIDTRTDVYSLGVLLYELLIGVKPFDWRELAKSADHEVRRIIREVDPPAPSTRLTGLDRKTTNRLSHARQLRIEELRNQLKRELEWIPLMAMRKEPGRRYTSPLQLAEDIDHYLEGQPLIAGPESRGYRLKKFASRNKATIATVASIVIVLSAGIAGTATQSFRANRQARIATAAAREADSQRTIAQLEAERAVAAQSMAVAARRSAELEAQRQRLVTIDLHINAGELSQARKLLELPIDPELENEWYWRGWTYARRSHVIDRIDLKPAFADDAMALATVFPSGSLGFNQGRLIAHVRPVDPRTDQRRDVFVDVESSRIVQRTSSIPRQGGSLGFERGPINVSQAGLEDQSYVAVDIAGLGEIWSEYMSFDAATCMAYRGPDTNPTLAISSSRTGIHCIKVDASTMPPVHQSTTVIPPHGDQVIALVFSEDGNTLHGLTDDWYVMTWRLPAQIDLTQRTVNRLRQVRRLNYTHNGKELLAGSYGGGVSVWDTANQLRLLDIQAHPEHTYGAFGDVVEVSHQRSFVSSTWNDETIREHSLVDGRPLRTFDNGQHMARIVISDDGRYMFATGSQLEGGDDQLTVRKWDLETPMIIKQSVPLSDSSQARSIIYNLELFDNGRTLAVVLRDVEAAKGQGGTTQCVLLDAETLDRVGSLPATHTDTLRDLDVSPDGRLLAIASRDGTASVWDWRHRHLITQIEVERGRAFSNVVSSVRFHPTMPVLMTISMDRMKLWDTRSWRQVAEQVVVTDIEAGLKEAEFSPDGSQLVLAAGRELWWIDLNFHQDTIDRLRAKRDAGAAAPPAALTRPGG
ncbi:MAG: protein kinase [Planctomycetota bacterium]